MVDSTRQTDETKRNAALFGGEHVDGASLAMGSAKAAAAPHFDESPLGLLKEGTSSFVNSAVVEPVHGVAQLFGVKFENQHAQAEFGTNAWYAQTIGSGAGMVVPFLLTSKATSLVAERIPIARSLAQPAGMLGEDASFAARFTRPVIKSTIDGAVFGAVFTPSQDDGRSLLSQRFTSALSGGLTFGSMTAMSSGLMMGYGKFGLPVENAAFQTSLKGFGLRLGTNALSGGFAGVVSAESNSLLSGKGFATGDELKQSVASFLVTGGALDTFHFAKESWQARQEQKAQQPAQPQPFDASPVSMGEARLVGARRGGAVADAPDVTAKPFEPIKIETKVEGKTPSQTADINTLLERVSDRQQQMANPSEAESAAQAIDRLMKAPKLEVPLTDEQRVGLAKQLLYEAANPKTVDQSGDYACGPAAVLQMAQYSNPGKHISAIVDLVTTGKTTTADGGIVDLSQSRLKQIDQALGTNQYANALLPDASSARTLERAGESGVAPIIDGTASYANQLGMLLYGNVRSQLLAPEGERAVYVKGKPDRALVEDTGERLFQIKANGQVEPLRTKEGETRIGPGVESRDLQRMYDAITGNDSSQNNFVLLNTREPLEPHQGTRVLSPRELESALMDGTGPKVLEINADALNRNGAGAEATSQQPQRHVVLVEPAIDQRGRQVKRDGEPLFNVIDNYGRQNDLLGKEGMTAKELFDASRQPNESPRIEPAIKLEGVGNFAQVDEGFYRGRKPEGEAGIKSLKEKGVTLIIDMIEGDNGRDQEAELAAKHGIKYLNIKTSVADFGPDSVKQVFDAIQKELDADPNAKVFLHCARGVDRTGTIAALWRMTHQDGWTPRLAQAEMRQFGWNGHTRATERMGDMVANPPSDFVIRTPGEPLGREAREIGRRNNPHTSFNDAVQAANRLFDQPWLANHPDLEGRTYEVYNSLDTRAPEVVSQGVTNVMNRLADAMESGSVLRDHVDSLLRAVEARVNGQGGYDAFFDLMRDKDAADHMELRDLVDLKDMSADRKGSTEVLGLYRTLRADLVQKGIITDGPLPRTVTEGIDPKLTAAEMTQMLGELPPFERQGYLNRLSKEWSDGTPEHTEARKNLLQAYLSNEASYDSKDALSGFKDLVSDPSMVDRLNGSQIGRLVLLITRDSNPTRAQDVARIVDNTSAFNFNDNQRVQLLRYMDQMPRTSEGLAKVAAYANPELMTALEKSRPDVAHAISRLMLDATVNTSQLDPKVRRQIYQTAGPHLDPSELGTPNSPRFHFLFDALGPEALDRMSNKTFTAFLENAKQFKWKGSKPDPLATQEKLQELLAAAGSHADPARWPGEKELTGKTRQQMVANWNALIENIPDMKARKAARFAAFERMTADDISTMQGADKNMIKNALAGDLIEQLPTRERTQLLTKLLFASHYNDTVSSVDYNRIVKLLTERPNGVAEMPVEDVALLRDSLEEYLGDAQPDKSLPPTFETTNNLVNMFVGEPLSRTQMQNVFDGFSQHEMDSLVTALNDRAPNLSMKGLAQQFGEIANDLRREGFLQKYNNFKDSSFKDAEKVNIITLGDSSSGRALAYLFYKTTGIKANVITMRPGEEAHIPTGKAVLFDPLSKADPSQRTFLENMRSQNDLFIPNRLQSFSEGVNLFDVADAGAELNGGPATERLRAKLAGLIGAEVRHNPASRAATPAQEEGLATALTGYSARDIEVARAQTALWLASEKLNDWHHYEKTHPEVKLTDWDQIEGGRSTAQVRAALVHRVSEFVSFPEMINQSKELHRRILAEGNKGQPIPQDKLLFITDADTGGSGDLLTYMYRNANGMEGKQYDRQFVTMEKAAALMKADPTLQAVGIDDIVYSGTQLETQAKKIMQTLRSYDVNARGRLILGTLGHHQEGLTYANNAIRVAFGDGAVGLPTVTPFANLTHFVDAVQNGADPQSVWSAYSSALFWSDGKLNGMQRNDWYDKAKKGEEKQWLKSGIVLPYMVPNNNLASLNSLYANFLGRPKAKPTASYVNSGTVYAE